MSTPKGGLPQGYSYMAGGTTYQGTQPIATFGPNQGPLHPGGTIEYRLQLGPLAGVLVTTWPGANAAFQGPQMTPIQAEAASSGFQWDPNLVKYINFWDALKMITDKDLQDWFGVTDPVHGRVTTPLWKQGVENVDERARIVVATLQAIDGFYDTSDDQGRAPRRQAVYRPLTITYGGPDIPTSAAMVNQVRTLINRIQHLGPLPDDHDGHPDFPGDSPETWLKNQNYSVPDVGPDGPTDDNSVPTTRTVYFYRFDHSKVDGDGNVNNAFEFCNYGLSIMVRDTGKNWYIYKGGAGNSGFFRRNEDGSFSDVATAGQFLQDTDGVNIIIDVCIIVVELVVDYFTGGATAGAFAAINPMLFAVIKGALTGDTSQIFSGVVQAAELAFQIAGPAAEQMLGQTAKQTAAFLFGAPGSDGTGVGGSLNNIYKNVAGQFAKAAIAAGEATINGVVTKLPSNFVDNLVKQGTTLEQWAGRDLMGDIDKVGHGMIHSAFDGAANGTIMAATDSFATGLSSTLGGAGSAADHWFQIGHGYLSNKLDAINTKIQAVTDPTQYVAQAKAEISTAVSEAMAMHQAPDYAKNAVYMGAMLATVAAVQANRFVPDPVLRTYKQSSTTFAAGSVPPELQTALAASNALADTVLKKPLALLGPPTSKTVLAANANVLPSQIGPNVPAIAVAGVGTGTLVWLGKDTIAKYVGKPAWSNYIVAGAVLTAAGLAWYLTRNTIHGAPLTNANTGGNPTPALPSYKQALAAYQAAHAQGADWLAYGAPAVKGKASTAPSTTSLIALSEPSHIYTVQEVQFLLTKWGSNPVPTMSGNWDDATDKAVRDFQTREHRFGIMNIDGDPFSQATSRALQGFAGSLLTSQPQNTALAGGISISDLQTLISLPVTGVMDAQTQAKLNLYGPMLYPPAPKGTQLSLSEPRVQVYFTAMAKQSGRLGQFY